MKMLTEHDRKKVERVIVEFWRQVEVAGPSSKTIAMVQKDRSGRVSPASGVQPPAVTLDDLDED